MLAVLQTEVRALGLEEDEAVPVLGNSFERNAVVRGPLNLIGLVLDGAALGDDVRLVRTEGERGAKLNSYALFFLR